MMTIYVVIIACGVFLKSTELNKASIAVVRQVINTIARYAATDSKFPQ